MAIETLHIKSLAKFSVVTDTDEYVNWHKDIKESDKGKVVPGGVYECEVERKESGKGYIKSVVVPQPPVITPPVAVTPKAIETKPFAATPKIEVKAEVMSKSDWASKDRSMMIGGLSHDAATLAAASAMANAPLEQLLSDYTQALGEILRLREIIK